MSPLKRELPSFNNNKNPGCITFSHSLDSLLQASTAARVLHGVAWNGRILQVSMVEAKSKHEERKTASEVKTDAPLDHRRIYVSDVPPSITAHAFRDLFEGFGSIVSMDLKRSHTHGGYLPYAFVTFASWEAAEAVLKAAKPPVANRSGDKHLPPGLQLGDHRLHVAYAVGQPGLPDHGDVVEWVEIPSNQVAALLTDKASLVRRVRAVIGSVTIQAERSEGRGPKKFEIRGWKKSHVDEAAALLRETAASGRLPEGAEDGLGPLQGPFVPYKRDSCRSVNPIYYFECEDALEKNKRKVEECLARLGLGDK